MEVDLTILVPVDPDHARNGRRSIADLDFSQDFFFFRRLNPVNRSGYQASAAQFLLRSHRHPLLLPINLQDIKTATA
jgi:hypothetical protein